MLPGFVGFPGIARVEQVEGVEPLGVPGQERGDGAVAEGRIVGQLVERKWGRLRRVDEMPARVGHRMGVVVARDVGAGRERTSGDGASGSSHGGIAEDRAVVSSVSRAVVSSRTSAAAERGGGGR
jgi:hypothetical protein